MATIEEQRALDEVRPIEFVCRAVDEEARP